MIGGEHFGYFETEDEAAQSIAESEALVAA
jgi:hypothetical protein